MDGGIVDNNGLLPLRIQSRDEILKHFYHHKAIDRTLNQIRRKGVVASEETQRLQAFTPRRFQLDGLPFLLPSIGDINIRKDRKKRFIKILQVDFIVRF